MFEVLADKGLGVNALNAMGLYTRGQVDELDKRVEELWKTLNDTYAALATYIGSIEQMTDENYSWCGHKWTDEEKKKEILRCCDILRERKEMCWNTLLKRQT